MTRIYVSNRSLDLDVFEQWTSNLRYSAVTKELVWYVSVLDPALDLLTYSEGLWKSIQYRYAELDIDFRGSDRSIQEIFHHVRWQRLLKPDEDVDAWFEGQEEFVYNPDQDRDIRHELGHTPAKCFLQYALVVEGYNEYIKQATLEQEAQRSGKLLKTLSRRLENLPNVNCIKLREQNFHFASSMREPRQIRPCVASALARPRLSILTLATSVALTAIQSR